MAWRAVDGNAVPFPIDQPNIVLSDTYTISPTLISEFRLGFNRRKSTKSPETSGQDWASQPGIPGVSSASFPFFVPSGSPSGSLIPSLSAPVASPSPTYYRTGPGGSSSEVWEDMQGQENLTKLFGKHTIKGGYEIMRTRYNLLVESLPSGKVLHERNRVAIRYRHNHR